MAVVDRREHDMESARSQLEAKLVSRKVLKGGVLDGFGIPFADPNSLVSRDSLLDEINRLVLRIEEEKAQLSEVKKETREAREAAAREKERFIQEREEFERERAERDVSLDADILNDETYKQRVAHITELQEQARTDMEQMSAQLEQDAKEAWDRAQSDGYNEGYEEGRAAAKRDFEKAAAPKLAELAQLITSLTQYGPELFKKREDEFVELALAVAGKIVAKELKTKPSLIVGMINEFIKRNQREAYINISISPDLLPASAKASDELLEQLKALNSSIVVYVEKDAPAGTVILETPKGVTDMSIPSQLENIRETVME
ncbi:MAG: FliH/SctL family protein [Oscillospiraceae bacterium]|nr:FliH/SctL family protein [Oscillospiraceae bacterium]